MSEITSQSMVAGLVKSEPNPELQTGDNIFFIKHEFGGVSIINSLDQLKNYSGVKFVYTVTITDKKTAKIVLE